VECPLLRESGKVSAAKEFIAFLADGNEIRKVVRPTFGAWLDMICGRGGATAISTNTVIAAKN
jgi:hypothetical protein